MSGASPGTYTDKSHGDKLIKKLIRISSLKRLKPGKPTLILLGALVIVIVLFATRPADIPEPKRERAWSVEVQEVEPAEISPMLELFGQVQSPQDADLSAGIEAVVQNMLVRDGTYVEEGQELIVLDDRDAQLALQQSAADLKESQAQMNFAKIRLTRSRQAYEKEKELLAINEERNARAAQLFDEGLLSQADSETAAENLARQQLALNQAELNVEENSARLIELEARIARNTALRDAAAIDLERTRLKAPFAGVISEVAVSQGDRVRIGDRLMRLQNPDAIEIRAQLPSRIAKSVSDGLQEGGVIRATAEADGYVIHGRLLRVSGQTSAGSGGVDSFIGIDSGAAGLRLGSTIRIMLELPTEQNVIAVPGEAIYGSDRLYKLSGDRMKMIEIERVGERSYGDGRTEVLVRTPLLDSADKIIVTKLANAADGLLVAPADGGQPNDGITKLSDSRPLDNSPARE